MGKMPRFSVSSVGQHHASERVGVCLSMRKLHACALKKERPL